MSLVTITRGSVEYNINSSLANINRFTDANGNVSYQVDFEGSDRPVELTESEYNQFNSNENNVETEE